MEKPNKEFLKKYFNGGATTVSVQDTHFYAQNLLLRDIAKSLAPDIIYKEKVKVNLQVSNP